MNLFESQLKIRSRLDNAQIIGAYSRLADALNPTEAPASGQETDPTGQAVAACLSYYGAKAGSVPENAVDEYEKIQYLCRPSGTMFRKVQLDSLWYRHTIGPMLVHLDDGKAAALIPRGFQGYEIFCPGSGTRTKVNSKTAGHIQHEAVFFYRALSSGILSIRSLMVFMARCLNKTDYLAVFLTALAVTLGGLLPAWVNALAFGTVIPAGQSQLIAPLAALLTGAITCTLLLRTCGSVVLGRIAAKMGVYTESAVFSRLLSLPASFFRRFESGNLAVRIFGMKDLAKQLTQTLLGSGLACCLCLLYLAQIAVYAPSLVLPALAIVLGQAALLLASSLLSAKYERAKMDKNAQLSGTVTSILNGIQKIRLAGAEKRAFARWAGLYADYARPAYSRPALLQALPACVGIVGVLGGILIFNSAARNHVDTAEYMAFFAAYGQMSAAILEASRLVRQMVMIQPMIDMIAPVLEEKPENASEMPMVSSIHGSVQVSDIAFRYDEKSPFILKNVSFSVKPGEYIAVVGRSGSGKSTLVRLLLGFEKPEKGTIHYDKNDLSKVDQQSLRRQIGAVTQNGRLFTGNIFYNIIVSSPTATQEDAWEAAELAGIAEDIRNMPMGMQTWISENGSGLSGGQRQRLLIARAICRRPKVLILDEATSALDNLTQKHVSDSLDRLDCTRIVIAHRLSTVRNCDRILCLDHGQIVEEGSYSELIEKNGFFAELVARQQIDTES